MHKDLLKSFQIFIIWLEVIHKVELFNTEIQRFTLQMLKIAYF